MLVNQNLITEFRGLVSSVTIIKENKSHFVDTSFNYFSIKSGLYEFWSLLRKKRQTDALGFTVDTKIDVGAGELLG